MSSATQSSASLRIASLLDENSFVEIGGLVTARATDFNMEPKETPSDGVITGYGVIDGNLVYIYSQDASVMNGSIGEMHAKKIIHLYDMAMKMGAPIIGLLDSAGLRLQEGTDAMNAFGQIYAKQVMASGVIPQITGIFGKCGGGLSLFSTLTDFTFMEEKEGKLYLNSPNALDGNYEGKCDTASAKFQSESSGIVDRMGTESSILEQIRELICMLPQNNEEDAKEDECTDQLNRTCPALEQYVGDPAIALSQISDNGVFFEIKENYAKDMVTGFLKLNGMTVGVVANRTEIIGEDEKVAKKYDAVLSCNGCYKAGDFIQFCDAFHIPLLSLTNVKGFEATIESEKGMATAVAKLAYAFANATVPKVNIIVGKAYGSAGIVMNSKAIGADLTFAWTDAKNGTMDPKLAAQIMYHGKGKDVVDKKAKEYEALQLNVTQAARRGYVDQIIEAKDTRKYVIGAFEMLYTKREERPGKKHGTV